MQHKFRLNTFPIVRFSVNHPWIIITISLIITLLFALPLGELKIQADVESLLPENMEEFETPTAFDASLYDKLLVMVKGEDLFTLENLQLFEETCGEIEENLAVASTVDPFSMVTLAKAGVRLTAVPLSPEGRAPQTESELEVFVSRLAESRFAPGAVCSVDRDALAAYFLIEKPAEYLSLMEEIEELLIPLRGSLEVSVTGTIPFSAETEHFLTDGFLRLLVFVLLTILASYYIGFRSKRAVFLPITLVISGTIFALGIMALAGFELTMVSIISPPLILTLGSSYSIHVMNAYYSGAGKSNREKKVLLIESVTEVSSTVLLASFTTLVGLMSLLFASIIQTRQFAIATALGIFFTAILSITLLPAFLALQRVPHEKRLKTLARDPLALFLKRFSPALAKAEKPVLIIILIITAAFVILTPQVEFNTSPSKYFPASSSVIKNHSAFLGEIGGYDELTVELTGPEEDYFLRPDVLEEIHGLERKLAANPNVSYLFSFPRYLEYAGLVMTGQEGYFKSKGLNLFVSRLFGTFDSGAETVNEDYSQISLTLRVLNRKEVMPIDEKDTKNLVRDISAVLNEELDEEIQWKLEGTSLGFLKLSEQMRRDFMVSTLMALVLITLTAALAFRSFIKGLLALIPLLMGIFTSFILMVIFDIPLDMTTIMVSCITIGVGVDDSIHFLLYHRRMKELYPGQREKAVQETLLHTGRPIIITTLSIVAGLIFLAFARFQPIRYFGLLIVFTLITACFSTIVLLPSLTKITEKKRND